MYSLVMRVRNALYDRGQLTVHRAAAPVVSIGNITTGGTGKTPHVIALVQRLRSLGSRPAVLTRGYGARAGSEADEVAELRSALPETPIVVNPDRVAGARRAVTKHAADCLVLDDGFQHRRLYRDLDIVLVDALAPWGGGRVLPFGRLREPLGGLGRAHAIVMTRADQSEEATLIEIERRAAELAPAALLLRSSIELAGVLRSDGSTVPTESRAALRPLAVCGLGNPLTFQRLAKRLFPKLAGCMAFGDHAAYTTTSVERIGQAARERHADCVLTTRKDWVKLTQIWRDTMDLPLLVLRIHVSIDDPAGRFDALLKQSIGLAANPAPI